MIISEQTLLEFRCQLERLITKREGMIALNKQREVVGHSMAYEEDSFLILAEDILLIHNALVTLGEK